MFNAPHPVAGPVIPHVLRGASHPSRPADGRGAGAAAARSRGSRAQALLCRAGLLALACAAPVAHAAAYSIVDLGSLGGRESRAYGVNATGQIAGMATLAPSGGSGDFTTPDGPGRAFVWSAAGGMQNLGILGGNFSEGRGINAGGQVTGMGATSTGSLNAFVWSPAGGMQGLGTLGGTYSAGYGINDAGHVTGNSETSGGETHAFLWSSAGGMQDLGTLGGPGSFGGGINAAGQVTGLSTTSGGEYHAFLWSAAGGMQDLGTLGGGESGGWGLNGAGQVVGQAFPAAGTSRAFIWSAAGGMQDINALIDPASGWTLESAQAINDAGEIVGYGTIGGQTHAFFLSPVPEPQEWALLLSGLGLIGWRVRRRRDDRPA